MLHPVSLLPTSPAIVQQVQAQNTTVSGMELTSAKVLATFEPEFSPLAVSKSSVDLGQPQAVGYPIQRFGETLERVSVELPKLQDKQNKQTRATNLETSGQNNKQNTFPSISIAPVSQTADTLPKEKIEEQKIIEVPILEVKPGISDPQNSSNSLPTKNILKFNSRSQTAQNPPVPPLIIQPPTDFRPQDQPASPIQPPSDTTDQPQNQPTAPTQPPARERVVEISADKTVYDEQRRVVTAEGNVVVRFDGAVVDANRLQVNLDNLIAVGEGNVVLTRGDQVLRGQRFTYNFLQDSGDLINGSGEIFIPTAGQDLAFTTTGAPTGPGGVPARPLSARVRENQPRQASSPGGINITVGGRSDARNLSAPQPGGQIRRLRFQAARIDFYPRGWQARDVRITNDPFSPPELELRANKVTLTRESPLRDRIKTEQQRLVFDRGLSVPIPRDEQVIDRREREVTPGIASIGFDGDQRGGLFIERSFKIIETEPISWSVTPQFFVQEAAQSPGTVPSLFGLTTRFNAILGPRTIVQGSGVLTSLDFGDIEDNLRTSLRLRQTVGDRFPHIVALEYSYRDRLYNGSLGFQTVQSSLGGVVTSPVIPLGNSGISLTYQAGSQYISATTDRQDLLGPNPENDRVSLTRLQGNVKLNGGRSLWQGKALPATATEGLRYTPNPVVPYLRAFGEVSGTTSYYTSGDTQNTLIGTVGLEGQFGNFSRPLFDYTAFLISYSQGATTGPSPFLFDRFVDTKVFTFGLSQQLYGPFRFGFQTSINVDTGERISTDYILEYSRRTYGIVLRYNPVLELGGISLRISDFNWTGGTDPFSNPAEIKPVVGGVRQDSP